MCFNIAVIVAFAVGVTRVATAQECGVEASSSLVHHNPWTALVMYFSGDHLTHTRCGATLIDSRHVITAAHCVRKPKFSRLEIRLGEYDLENEVDCKDGVCNDRVLDIAVEAILVHPEYNENKTHDHDIAILRLKKEAPYTDFIRPVCLPTGQLSEDVVFEAAGWGIIPRRGEYSQTKKLIPLPYFNKKLCESAYPSIVIPKSAICAGGEAGIDTCSGDSGGPLVWIKEKVELWGVTSMGNVHCGTKGTPGTYVNVQDHLDWIRTVLS